MCLDGANPYADRPSMPLDANIDYLKIRRPELEIFKFEILNPQIFKS